MFSREAGAQSSSDAALLNMLTCVLCVLCMRAASVLTAHPVVLQRGNVRVRLAPLFWLVTVALRATNATSLSSHVSRCSTCSYHDFSSPSPRRRVAGPTGTCQGASVGTCRGRRLCGGCHAPSFAATPPATPLPWHSVATAPSRAIFQTNLVDAARAVVNRDQTRLSAPPKDRGCLGPWRTRAPPP